MASTVATISRNSTSQLSKALTVSLTVGGTATFNTDYTVTGASTFTSTNATVVILAGQLTAQITLTTVPDTIFEPDETVILAIVTDPGVTNGGGTVTWTIINDDNELQTLTISLSSPSSLEG